MVAGAPRRKSRAVSKSRQIFSIDSPVKLFPLYLLDGPDIDVLVSDASSQADYAGACIFPFIDQKTQNFREAHSLRFLEPVEVGIYVVHYRYHFDHSYPFLPLSAFAP